MSTGIGALIITRNEEKNIVRCLETLAFCDERVVVDSFSSDRTVERARPLAEHIYRRRFTNHAEQKNWGLDQMSTPWVLILDADERVTDALSRELIDIAASEAARDAYWLKRSNTFFGSVVSGSGWNRDRVLRFLRRDAGRYEERYLHEEVSVFAGRSVGTCGNALLHHSYVEWPSTFERLLSYSSRGARDRSERGRSARPLDVIVRPFLRWIRQFGVQAGFRDGVTGLVLCAWSAFGISLREMKLALGQTVIPPHRGAPRPSNGVEVVQGRSPQPGAEVSGGRE